MTTLAEVRERHDDCSEHNFIQSQSGSHQDRAFLLSLLDEIEALPDKWDETERSNHGSAFEPQATGESLLDGYDCANDLRAIMDKEKGDA